MYVLPLILFLFFFQKQSELPDSYIGKDVSIILAAMPKSDREKLEYFFLELIALGGFGYVLLGEKPMALDVASEKIHPFAGLSGFKHAIIPRRTKSASGFKTWEKYKKFFPTSRFIFLYEKDSRDNLLIILINKNAFIQKIQQHANDFKRILQREVRPEELLKEGISRPLLSDILMNHDTLIGILLGYGRDNAYLFHQKSQLSSDEEIEDFCEKFQFGSVWTDEEFEELRKKFDSVGWISSYITGSHMRNLDLMTLPGFGGVFACPETQHWRKHYLETKKAIIEFYEDKDFLETTLRLLTS